jgi:flavin-dependent dehydrogenase
VGARQRSGTRRAGRRLPLEDGSRVAVIGGGPAGSLFAYFLLRFATSAGLDLHADIFEPRDFDRPGPRGCNMCGGLVAGSLVDLLRAEGITIPPDVVQSEIDGYSLLTQAGRFRVAAPSRRTSALAVFRGGGPRDDGRMPRGLDAFLLSLATGVGAEVVPQRITSVDWHDGHPEITLGGVTTRYDLVVVAIGVNLAPGHLLDDLGLPTAQPRTARAYVTELRDRTTPARAAQPSTMGVVLLDIPGIDAVGVIPKGGFSTLCVLGPSVDRPTVTTALADPMMCPYRQGDALLAEGACHCSPNLNVREAPRAFADRVVLVGDCGVTRLYKDGLGSALRTARAAAATAIRRGVSERDFRGGYGPVYRGIARDNRYGAIVFGRLARLQSSPRLLRASVDVMAAEQRSSRTRRPANAIIWDVFTGGAPYRDILLRACNPLLALRVGLRLVRVFAAGPEQPDHEEGASPSAGPDEVGPDTRGSPGAELDGSRFGG